VPITGLAAPDISSLSGCVGIPVRRCRTISLVDRAEAIGPVGVVGGADWAGRSTWLIVWVVTARLKAGFLPEDQLAAGGADRVGAIGAASRGIGAGRSARRRVRGDVGSGGAPMGAGRSGRLIVWELSALSAAHIGSDDQPG
jgi:hypothetical protein